uniref:RP1 like 1 n=1 Tax=Pundamilia nyererei TaxID=303518 RepID=A0A3B4FJY9_9CICH
MHSVQTGLWNPRPPFKHVFPIPAPPPSNSRPAHVSSTTPAKRITFYKSGDSQFGGVRMAIHKRSFKCFDALLDDLSQKVPLPFGVRTVTTPRGTHTIKHLEQLQDGGCYLCSDRRQAKPVNMELVNKHSGIWYHHNRRPQRPETSSATPPGHLHMPYRQRRILLVKNSEPGMRRSVVLSRRTARSLRAFLDEVSEVMQFHVRKIYTVEGRRIDSVQSLMTCPGVLVCVGREAFSPLLINFIRKTSEEKLPGLGPRTPGNGARSPATQGISIIHPRSDSSNRSARFSFSSEKSYGNGVTACPQGKPAIMNDDIEKRVLVNKDGSLSVEMRVRFHLQNDETLQWSTQIKKSPSLSNECCPLSQLEGNRCPCCHQRHEQHYDLWENPAHSHKSAPVPPPHAPSHTHSMMRHTHSSSSSSSCNSRRVVRCRARLSSCGGGSGSEQSKLVQEEMLISSQSPCCLRAESADLASDQSKEKDQVECKSRFSTGSDCGSVKMASSLKKGTPIKSSSPCPLHSKVETCSESTLSQSLSAADFGMCQRRSNQMDKREELTPACLPNTSPSEVVSDWLRSIPANSSMLALGDEFNEEELTPKEMEEMPGGELAQESPEGEKLELEEKGDPEEDEEKEDGAKCEIAQEEKGSDPTSGDAEGTSGRPSALLLQSEALPRSWQSSAAVMKVLLSSSLGRCRSMPEVSQLLFCDRKLFYIMAILHSLWLTEPGNIQAKETKENKNSSPEQVTPPRSSSGVDMSSGSAGSGKENGNQGEDETPPKERESLQAHEVAENIVEEEEEGNEMAGDTDIETEHKETFTDQAKADTAEEPVQSEEAPQKSESSKPSESSDKTSAKDSSKSPTDNEHETLEDSSTGTPPTVLRASLAKRPSQDPDPVWVLHLLKKLEKQFMVHYINAVAEFKVRWDLDDSHILDTMICELRDEVSRRIQGSIEREMRKIQGRAGRGGRSPRPPQGTHLSRESTTTEKRRQMLKVNLPQTTSESLSDGEMTGEFSDQRSDDEYCPCEACVRKKMAARPFKINPLAAEAPVMKDFDLLKILQLKKSPAPATVPQPAAVEDESQAAVDDDGRNLDVVQEEEEDEETKEDIRAVVVLEETIAEEDEEAEKENNDGKAREEEETEDEQEENEESDASKEEEEEEGTSGEEVREDETSETGGEDEEHQCKCTRNEDESDQEEDGEEQTGEDEEDMGEDETEENEGDTGTGEEEETSDQDTVKEASVGKGETPENEESDERVDDKEKPTEGESVEEGEDSAAEMTENEKSTLSKEVAERDSASAEGEDDEEDDTGEGESSEEQEGEASEKERTSPQVNVNHVFTEVYSVIIIYNTKDSIVFFFSFKGQSLSC